MRTFDVGQLANRSVVGDATRAYGQVASVLSDYDDRNHQRKMRKRADEEYQDATQRRTLLRGREDTAYRQGQEDRTRRLSREDVLNERQDEMYAEGKTDRAQQRQIRSDQHQMSQDQHGVNMYKASEYKNQEGYRRQMEKLQLAGAHLGLDAQKMQMQEARFDQERKKEAVRGEKIAKDAQRLQSLLNNNSGDTDEINKVARRIAEYSGLEFDQIDENFQAITQLQDALQQGVELDDPAIQPMLKALWESKGYVDGRKGKWEFERMQKVDGGGYVPMLRSPDGKAGAQTFGKSSDPDDIAQEFDPVDIMESSIGLAQIAKQLKTVKDAYGLTPPPKERSTEKLSKDQRLVDSQTGEVIVDSQAGGTGAADELSKQAEILGKHYEESGDVQGQMAHSALAEKGIVSQQAVEQAKELAGESGDINKAAALIASRTRRQERLAEGPAPIREALKETLDRHEGLTAEAVDLVTDKEINKILSRFAESDQISVDQMLSEVAEAASQVAASKQAKEKRKTRIDQYRNQPSRTLLPRPGQTG